MPKFEGYHTELPIKQNQEIVIPAGVKVRSMRPGVSTYVTKRKQTVKVRMIMPGQSVPARIALNDKDYYNPLKAAGFDFSVLERLRDEDYAAYEATMVPISNPSVTWAGTGGYWCDVDINDVLEANGL